MADTEEIIKQILDDADRAATIIEQHPGQSYEQIKTAFESNSLAHINAGNHIAVFISNVFGRKGDINTLADSAAKRIVLSDPRIEQKNKNLQPEQKAKTAEGIYDLVVKQLIDFITNLKGKNLDQDQVVEQLTTDVTKMIAAELAKIK